MRFYLLLLSIFDRKCNLWILNKSGHLRTLDRQGLPMCIVKEAIWVQIRTVILTRPVTSFVQLNLIEFQRVKLNTFKQFVLSWWKPLLFERSNRTVLSNKIQNWFYKSQLTAGNRSRVRDQDHDQVQTFIGLALLASVLLVVYPVDGKKDWEQNKRKSSSHNFLMCCSPPVRGWVQISWVGLQPVVAVILNSWILLTFE